MRRTTRRAGLGRLFTIAAAAIVATVVSTGPASANTFVDNVDVSAGSFADISTAAGTCTTLDGSEVLPVNDFYLAHARAWSFFKVDPYTGQLVLQTTDIAVCGNESTDFSDLAPQAANFVWGTNQLTITSVIPTDQVMNNVDPSAPKSWNVHLTSGAGAHTIVYKAVSSAQQRAFKADKAAYDKATTLAAKADALNKTMVDVGPAA